MMKQIYAHSGNKKINTTFDVYDVMYLDSRYHIRIIHRVFGGGGGGGGGGGAKALPTDRSLCPPPSSLPLHARKPPRSTLMCPQRMASILYQVCVFF